MKAIVGTISADDITIADVGSLFSSSDVESVVQEIGLTSSDDGTYIYIKRGSTTLLRIVKSSGNIQVAGGLDTDVTFP